jgi:hypothetical protein
MLHYGLTLDIWIIKKNGLSDGKNDLSDEKYESYSVGPILASKFGLYNSLCTNTRYGKILAISFQFYHLHLHKCLSVYEGWHGYEIFFQNRPLIGPGVFWCRQSIYLRRYFSKRSVACGPPRPGKKL